jgi:hypothetical protein
MISAIQLIDLLGLSGRDPRLASAVRELGFDKPVFPIDRKDERVLADFEGYHIGLETNAGLDFLFRYAERLPKQIAEKYFEGEPVLITIFFYPKSSTVLSQFPFGLTFADSRSVVRRKLGRAPDRVNDRFPRDIWNVNDEHSIAVDYVRDETSIKMLNVSWRKRNA